jgi:hypothetical protein
MLGCSVDLSMTAFRAYSARGIVVVGPWGACPRLLHFALSALKDHGFVPGALSQTATFRAFSAEGIMVRSWGVAPGFYISHLWR